MKLDSVIRVAQYNHKNIFSSSILPDQHLSLLHLDDLFGTSEEQTKSTFRRWLRRQVKSSLTDVANRLYRSKSTHVSFLLAPYTAMMNRSPAEVNTTGSTFFSSEM